MKKPQQAQAEDFGMPLWVPNLNITEYLCIYLKRACAVHARWPRNLTELENFYKEEWVKIPQTRIKRLLADYKKHLQAVIFAKGSVTRF